ncbi:MAG TPA: WYL domain-containing protein [Gemmatimonadaceae bacterium]|nr:WYL domain-containing protein [Gemmatimonadaceae bacterium]
MSRTPKIQRWVDLLAALLRRRFAASFDELAREVPAYSDPGQAHDARKRMFERDKDELRAFGVPIRSVVLSDGETHGYHLTSTDFYLPYLLAAERGTAGRKAEPRRVDRWGYHGLKVLAFEPEELEAVAEAAARVRAMGDPMLTADVDGAMRKLAFDLPLDAATPVEAPRVVRRHERVDADVYDRLGSALLRRKQVTFDYHTMESDVRARRTAEPYGLFFIGSHWYLAARDVEKGAVRNFRVGRISGVTINPARAQSRDYEVPADFSLREHARSRQAWELGDGAAQEAVVEFVRRSGAAVTAARLGEPDGAGWSDAADGVVRRRFRVRRPAVFARWLLSFAGDARPVAPGSLVAEFEQLRRETLALYRTEGTDG